MLDEITWDLSPGDRALHGCVIESDAARDLEARSLQFRGDVSGVIGWIGERRHFAIGAGADHQSDAQRRGRSRIPGLDGKLQAHCLLQLIVGDLQSLYYERACARLGL